MAVTDHHDCKLPLDAEENVVKHIIDTGIFIDTRRKLCELAIINKAHPRTELYYKSSSDCKNEQLRHLVNYPHMSHPFCIWCLYWEFFIFWVYLFLYISNAAGSFYIYDETKIFNLRVSRFVGDSILLMDIIHLFFKGYYDTEKSRTIMKQSEVVKKYLKTYFFLDLITLVPSYVFIVSYIGDFTVPLEWSLCSHIIGVFRLLRIGRWLDTLEDFRQYMDYSSDLFKGIKSVLVYFIIMVSIVALMSTTINAIDAFELGDISSNGIQQKFYSAALVLLCVSHGESLPTKAEVVVVVAFFLCVGYIMHLFLCAQVLQVWNKFARARDANENILRQFKEYMKYKGLSSNLRKRIYTYFQFKFHNEFYSEAQISSMISDLQKKEIWKHVMKKQMERSQLFRSFPLPVMLSMISHLKSVIYLPDDVIVEAGKRSRNMFFIYYGTVAVYTTMGREIHHLEDGDNFGEMALLFNESASATIVAVTPCELFRLRRTDFLSIIDSYPDLKAQILIDARNRLLKYRSETVSN